MLFSSIPGLEEVKEKIIQAVKNNHLAHALLFHGPEGSANLSPGLKAGDRIRTGDVQLGKLTFYH